MVAVRKHLALRVQRVAQRQSMELRYNSVSPVLRYDTGLFYGQLLPDEKGHKMARVSAKLRRLGILELLQFLQATSQSEFSARCSSTFWFNS